MNKIIAGKTLAEWTELSRRDDCLDKMVPSEVRALVNAAFRPEGMGADVEKMREGDARAVEKAASAVGDFVRVPRENATPEQIEEAKRRIKGVMLPGHEMPTDLMLHAAYVGFLKAAPAPQPQTEWRDISTAPRDGTDILVYAEGGEMFVAFWWQDGFAFASSPSGRVYIKTPKYWQPLPTPPASETEQKETGQ